MIVSATTTIPSAAEPCAVLLRFAVVKKAGLERIPTMKSTPIAGSRASSRSQRRTTRPLEGENSGRSTVESTVASLTAFPAPVPAKPAPPHLSLRQAYGSCGPESFGDRDQRLPLPRRLELPD